MRFRWKPGDIVKFRKKYGGCELKRYLITNNDEKYFYVVNVMTGRKGKWIMKNNYYKLEEHIADANDILKGLL